MALTSKQKKAAEILVAEPEKSFVDVAHEVGVDESTLWRWRKKDEFKDYEAALCRERFLDLERLCIQKLKENAMNNNQRAIEYALDFCGYMPKQEFDINSNDIVINITKSDADDYA